jgi:hypothetical protein
MPDSDRNQIISDFKSGKFATKTTWAKPEQQLDHRARVAKDSPYIFDPHRASLQ